MNYRRIEPRRKVLFACLALLGVVSISKRAEAQTCGSYAGTASNDTILVGEASAYHPWFGYYRTGRVAVCRKTGGSYYYDEIATCDDVTQHNLAIYGGDGSDLIAPLIANIRCGAGGARIFSFEETRFGFGFTAFGEGPAGTGGDTIYGTQNNDFLFSVNGGPYNDDGAGDLLCGYEGADWLYGDSSSTRERMSGGDGNDICTGGSLSNSMSIDHGWSCETVSNYVLRRDASAVDPCGPGVPISTVSAFPVWW
ncbi:MAG: hypothetical protein R3B99_11240 [Polyangiales bacterium]